MWWSSLTELQQVLFIIAVSATGIMLLFLILMLFGFEGSETFDGDVSFDDVDFDVYNDEPFGSFGGLRILTVRGALAFLSVGGWVAYLLSYLLEPIWAILIGAVVGIIAAYLLALAFKWSLKLESSGNIDYENAIGKTGTVYIRIPKAKSGIGKINIILQERLVEIDAITDDAEDIKVNASVEIIGLENETTLIVKRK